MEECKHGHAINVEHCSECDRTEGAAHPDKVKSMEEWADMIDDAKARGAINDMSSIAYRLLVIACMGGIKHDTKGA